MKLNRLIRILLAFLSINISVISYGERITFAGISMEIPDSMKYEFYDNGILSIVGKDCAMYFVTLGDPKISDKVNFDSDEIFKDLDRQLLPIDKYYDLQSIEKNNTDIYNHNINVRKKYVGRDNNSDIFLTQTFYTSKRPYVAAINYFGEETPASFDDIISSVDDGMRLKQHV